MRLHLPFQPCSALDTNSSQPLLGLELTCAELYHPTCRARVAMENWVMGCVPGGRSVRMVSTWAGIFLPLSASSADSASTCSLLGICTDILWCLSFMQHSHESRSNQHDRMKCTLLRNSLFGPVTRGLCALFHPSLTPGLVSCGTCLCTPPRTS